jgi:iron-sulfur cluster repair protein YtfE (RIC family)
MLATEILTKDHKEVLNMIEQLEDAEENSSTHVAIFEKLRDALEVHMQAEEEIYYPALARTDDYSDIMEENVPEHEGVKENLAQMRELDPGTDEFQELLTEMKAAIEMHANNEEENIFPESIELLGREEIEALGEVIEQLKGDAGMSQTARM